MDYNGIVAPVLQELERKDGNFKLKVEKKKKKHEEEEEILNIPQKCLLIAVKCVTLGVGSCKGNNIRATKNIPALHYGL